ncbi:amino acid permease [Pseudomonas sp. TH31]|uniref:amino acid permease n=1 Tax=Pseudomonas sp. TH31 TaxID=2796396 RepID=UPI00237BED00|nr:amino acid permease [Pseudomonas sp. TH31]
MAIVYLVCGFFAFLILRALGELVMHRPTSGSFVSYSAEFMGEKASYVAGWMYFLNWAMAGIVDITAVALYMQYGDTFAAVPQWVLALVALAIVTVINLIGVKLFGEIEFWFALIKVAALALFLVIGSIILGGGSAVAGHPTGLHLITDNGGFFPHGMPAALILVQGGRMPVSN